MTRCVIVYGTKEGHTAVIVQHVGDALRAAGVEVDAFEVSTLPPDFSLERYDAALVGSSVHQDEYQGAVKDFVRAHREWLSTHPSAFLSVSLSALAKDAEDRDKLARYVGGFVQDTGWQPAHVEHVAGALVYSQYPFFMRQVMKLIARQAGLETAADHDYTDYPRLAVFAREFAASLQARAA